MIMKKSLALAAVLGVATLLATPVVGNAADTDPAQGTTTGSTTATVGLEQDDTQLLTLVKVPSFNFGTGVKIGAQPLDLTATEAVDPVQVSNPGLASGWNVKVEGTDFKNGDTSTNTANPTLKGAQLILSAGKVAADDSGNTTTGPTSKDATIAPNEAGKYDPQQVFTAQEGNGIGVWNNQYAQTDAHLLIPSGNVAGSYTSTLTWTLTNAPA